MSRDRVRVEIDRASGPIEKGPGLDGLEPTWAPGVSEKKRLQKNNPKTAQDKYP